MENITISHDGQFDIAIGKHRKEVNWKNKSMSWSAFVKRISNTHRTAETYKEYLSAKKSRQDEIKDVGGYVGGYLTNGRRKNGNAAHRQLITLDIDFAPVSIWDDFSMLYGNAALIYSTHKHSSETPRFRLVLPLDREVDAEEYQAIARKIADSLNIDHFDHTTFQAIRLMYWPSTSKDGEYVFKYQDGTWLNADSVLATYHDWRDSSEWPMCSVEKDTVRKDIRKQGDPLEKPGFIGAFCRTYGIEEAIDTFLSDVYEPCDVDDRYSYLHGSTAGGLVLYDNKYAYSHHGTDPVSEKLCNAFDLVRIHKFGLKDEDIPENTPSNRLPSYIAMVDMCSKDKNVKKQIGAEKISEAAEDFADGFEPEENDADDSWLEKLEIDKNGIKSTIDNVYIFLKHHPYIKNRLFFDEFEGRLIAKRNLPWREVTESTKDFTDDDLDCLSHFLERNGAPFTQASRALSKIRVENRTHPVREFLDTLFWDGKSRIDTLFIDYLGAEDSLYTRSVTRKTLIGAVARVTEPGVKFDTVLTLVGPQGCGKSTIISKLAGRWFSDCLGDIHAKDGMESLRGVWIMEIAEMASFKKADQDAIKRFITSREDVYRPAYGKQQVRFPRQCIFFGTTNKSDFLSDPSGDRRFLPIDTMVQSPTKNVFDDLTAYEIGQIWAEALTYYQDGESIDLGDEVKKAAEKVRENHSVYDERTGAVEKYLDTLLPVNWEEMDVYSRRAFLQDNDETMPKGVHRREQVCAAEVWCEVLGGTLKDTTSQNTKPIHDILKKLRNWEPAKGVRKCGIYGRQRCYIRVNAVGVNAR